MNENEIIGVRKSEGISKNTGKPFSGYIIFYQFDQKEVVGKACDNVFVSKDLIGDQIPVPGMKVDLRYNRNGFLIDCILC